MTTEKPKVDPSSLYELNAAAKALGISRASLSRAARSEDKQRSIPFRIRKSNGRRVFKGQDIINYWLMTY